MPVQKQDDKAVADKAAADKPVLVEAPVVEKFDKNTSDAVDPRTGEGFKPSRPGLKGRVGYEALTSPAGAIPAVDPKRVPAEVTAGVTPNPGGDKLLAAAQAKAPSLTKEFVDAFEMTDQDVAAIARGEEPPPPTPGPVHTNDLYMTPGGWQVTPPGVPPEDVGKNAIAR